MRKSTSEAQEWLREQLQDGSEKSAGWLQSEATRLFGVSDRTLQRIATALGVKKRFDSGASTRGWYWRIDTPKATTGIYATTAATDDEIALYGPDVL